MGVIVWVAISLGLNRFYTESFCDYFSWLRLRKTVSRSSGGNESILTINPSIITNLENGLCSIIWVVENSLSHTLILNMSRICFDFCVTVLLDVPKYLLMSLTLTYGLKLGSKRKLMLPMA